MMFLGNGVLGWSRRSEGRDLLGEALLGEHFWNSFVRTGFRREVNEWRAPMCLTLLVCVVSRIGICLGHGPGNSWFSVDGIVDVVNCVKVQRRFLCQTRGGHGRDGARTPLDREGLRHWKSRQGDDGDDVVGVWMSNCISGQGRWMGSDVGPARPWMDRTPLLSRPGMVHGSGVGAGSDCTGRE